MPIFFHNIKKLIKSLLIFEAPSNDSDYKAFLDVKRLIEKQEYSEEIRKCTGNLFKKVISPYCIDNLGFTIKKGIITAIIIH